MATGKVFTGCRARFMLNGVKVGLATGVTVRESITYEPVKVLDNIQVEEHAPVDYDVSLTADSIKLVGTSFKSQGWLPLQGADPAEHLRNIIASGELTATIIDNQTGDVVANVEGVKIAETNLNIQARGIVGENVTMVAIRVRGESDLT
jgi:hypothetical protein